MTTKPKLFLHIGFPKTGTSTIQSYLIKNVDRLRSLGYLLSNAELEFPETGPVTDIPLVFFDRVRETGNHKTLYDQLMKLRVRLKDQWIGAIISSENLSITYEPFVQITEKEVDLNELFDIRVILYIRRQDDMILSSWKQWAAKAGLSLAAYVEQCLTEGFPFGFADYLTVIRRYEAVTNRKNIIVRPYARRYFHDHSLIDDFMRVLDIDSTSFAPVSDANLGLDRSLVEFTYRNHWLFESAHDNRIHTLIQKLLPADLPYEPPTLSFSTRKAILNHFAKDNAILIRDYLSDGRDMFDLSETDGSAVADPDDEIALLYRYLGFNLMMLWTLERQLSSQCESLGARCESLSAQYESLGLIKLLRRDSVKLWRWLARLLQSGPSRSN